LSRNQYSIEFVANIYPVFMASANEPRNGQRGPGWVQGDSVYTQNISSPHQTPALHHRASTGQLNQVAHPGTPIPVVQSPYPQWNQSPNISPHWHPAPMAAQYLNYNQVMPPPASRVPLATPSTPTPSRLGSAALKPYTKKLKIEQKLAVVFNAIDKDAHWTFSEFMYYAFRVKNLDGTRLR
jgi:hypothetical protein